MPSLFSFLPAAHPGRAVLDDERGDAAVALGAIGDGHHDHDAADAAVRDEVLRPVEHPARRPARTAVVRMPAASLPAPASVRPQAPSTSPRTRRGRYCCLLRVVPNIAMCDVHRPLCAATDSAIAGQTRASSSMQMQ